jgi:hypothetical protein
VTESLDDGFQKCYFVTDGGKVNHGGTVHVILSHEKVQMVIKYLMEIRDM